MGSIKAITIPSCYRDFHCIDTACTDTCCAGWQVDVDEVSWNRYRQEQGAFADYLHSVMVEIPGEEGQFRLKPDGRCPFLMDNGLCDLYAHLGEEALCRTCANYPRFMEEYGSLREVGIAFSCPEAARLMLSQREPMQFERLSLEGEQEYWDDMAKDIMWRAPEVENKLMLDDDLMSKKDANMDPEPDIQQSESGESETNKEQKESVTSYIDPADMQESFDRQYFDLFYHMREVALSLVQNRSFRIRERCILYLDLANEMQKAINRETSSTPPDTFAYPANGTYRELAYRFSQLQSNFSNPDWLLQRLKDWEKEYETKENEADAFALYGESIARKELGYRLLPEYSAIVYQELKPCKQEWFPLLEEAEELLHNNYNAEEYRQVQKEFQTYLGETGENDYEHWLSYHVFRYFCKAYFDDDSYGKAQLAVMAFLMVKELGACQYLKQNRTFSKEDQEWLFHLYSRELEHSEDNYETFVDLLRTESICNFEHLMGILVLG